MNNILSLQKLEKTIEQKFTFNVRGDDSFYAGGSAYRVYGNTYYG
jgi:hypothetical protein